MMKKLICLLLVVLCLPVFAVAEEPAEAFDLTGEWYTLMMGIATGATLEEKPESVDAMSETFVSSHGLENAVTYVINEDRRMWAVFEDGKLVDGAMCAPGMNAADQPVWLCYGGNDNIFHGANNLYTYNAEDFDVVDGRQCMLAADSVEGEFMAPIIFLSDDAFMCNTIWTPGLCYLFVRKSALDAAVAQ